MGKKIDYDPEDWDFWEETDSFEESNSFDDNRTPDLSLSDELFEGHFERQSNNTDETDITAYVGGEQIKINHHNTDRLPSSQEEEAFRRQIEDLFELLELEKKANKTEGIRVYQTDSSPSRPWRFH
jgi:hypothetical protein